MRKSRFSKDLKEIDALKDTLSAMRPLSDTELKRIQNEFMLENTYNSNAIEGNTLTLRETALVLQEGITIAGKPLKDHLEAVGHRDAFEYVAAIADAGEPLTERRIKEIHTLVLMNDAKHKGAYRNVPVMIMGAAHRPPAPHLVAEKMEELLADYETMKREQHIIEAIAKFHLRFEEVHPFIDGNGRAGRLIMNLELMKARFLPVNIKYIDRDKYYDCFDDYASTGTADMLAELVIGYELQELERFINIIEGMNGGGKHEKREKK
jgi:Fic family protein